MKLLKLSDTAATAPTEDDLCEVAYLMMFPDDAVLRGKVRRADDLIDLRMKTPTTTRPERYGLFLKLRSMPTYDLQKTRAIKRGLHAGAYLLKVLMLETKLPGSARTSELREIAARAFGVKSKTVETEIWAKFRLVAPLWAARVEMGGAFDVLPCAAHQLGELLAIAEHLRKLAETTHLKQSPTATILEPSAAYRVPEHIELPIVVGA